MIERGDFPAPFLLEDMSMKIAVTSTGPDVDSQVDPRFGRCKYYVIVDSDTMDFESIENPNIMAMGGAGIQSAQLVANKDVEVILTGNCGPNAFQTLSAAGVKVVIGVSGVVRNVVESFKKGELQPANQPSVAAKFGMGGGSGMGRGAGRGMGMGAGMGGGMMGPQPFAQQPFPGQSSPMPDASQELTSLKQQADYLKKQLDEITNRIKSLGKGGEK